MVKLVNVSEKDLNFAKVLMAHHDVMDGSGGIFYKAIIDGDEECYFCHLNETTYISYYVKDGEVYYDTFFVNPDNELHAVLVDNYMRTVDGSPIFYNLMTGMESLIEIIVRPEGSFDCDGFDALLTYSQYNPDNNLTLVTMMQFMSSASNVISPVDVREPFQIMLVQGQESVEHYILQKALNNKYLNVLTSVKDYGVLEVLRSGSYSLQREPKVKRYYKMYGLDKDGKANIHFPFCKSFSLDELEHKMIKLGFSFDIPEVFLQEFNLGNEDFDLYREAIKAIEEVESKELEPLTFVLKRGDSSES